MSDLTPNRESDPPPGARTMNVVRWFLFGGLLLLALVSIGTFVAHRRGAARTTSAQAAKYYCPMHPSYTSDRPGECPICGMSLEPIPASAQGATGGGDVAGLVPIHLSPQRIQLIGVRTARVERRVAGSNLDLAGYVTPDEARLSRVQIRVAGWVQELMVNRTGEPVRAGQPLLALYSPELYQSEQEFLIETSRDTTSLLGGPAMPQEAGGGSIEAARQRLRLLGVPDEEIARLERERKPSTRLVLRSPVTGTVLERGVTTGQSVSADTPLLTVADLGRLWVLADLYEMDYTRLRVGDPAQFTADAIPGRIFHGRIDFIYPTVSPDTRTLKARVALANSRRELLPGMYGRVRVARRGAPSLAVPAEAVVHSGEQNYVFLAHAGGHFEPRRVTLGPDRGDWVPVFGGLAEGDTVVASASFLIDSESRLKAAISGMGRAPETHTHTEAP